MQSSALGIFSCNRNSSELTVVRPGGCRWCTVLILSVLSAVEATRDHNTMGTSCTTMSLQKSESLVFGLLHRSACSGSKLRRDQPGSEEVAPTWDVTRDGQFFSLPRRPWRSWTLMSTLNSTADGDSDQQLSAHIHHLLFEYALTHLTTDYIQLTNSLVNAVRLQRWG